MSNIITLNNPSEKPFGELSNNAFHLIKIDGKLYHSVTNYIYSNMIITPSYERQLQISHIENIKSKGITPEKYQEDIHNFMNNPENLIDYTGKQQIFDSLGIYKLYNYYCKKELYEIIKKALTKAYTTKIKNKEVENALMHTGNAPILYIDNNDLNMGKNEHGIGLNLVGKILEDIRHRKRIEKRSAEILETSNNQMILINNIYIADIILKKSIQEGDDLNQYLDMSPLEIINFYGSKSKLIDNVPTQAFIFGLFKQNILNNNIMSEYINPGSLVISNRKDSLKKVQKIQNDKMRDTIFHMYLDYRIERAYPAYDKEMVKKARESQINEYTPKSTFTVGNMGDLYDSSIAKIQKLLSKITNEKRNATIEENITFDKLEKQAEKDKENEKEDLIKKNKQDIKYQKLNDIKQRVNSLFKLGMLSASLSERIDKEIIKIKIPTDEEIERVENSFIQQSEIKTEKKLPTSDNKVMATVSNTRNELIQQIIDIETSHIKPEDMYLYDKNQYNIWTDTAIKNKLYSITENKNQVTRQELIKILADNNWEDIETTEQKYANIPTDKLEQIHTGNTKLSPIPEFIADEKEDIGLYLKPRGNPFIIYPVNDNKQLDCLSPLNYSGMLNIDGLTFPSIYLYIMASIISSRMLSKTIIEQDNVNDRRVKISKGVPIITARKQLLKTFQQYKKSEFSKMELSEQNMINRQKIIPILHVEHLTKKEYGIYRKTTKTADEQMIDLEDIRLLNNQPVQLPETREDFVSNNDAHIIFNEITDKSDKRLFRHYNTIGLLEKFKDRGLQDLLLTTLDIKLEFADPNSKYLGIPNNITGIELQHIRSFLKILRNKEEKKLIDPRFIYKSILSNTILQKWVQNRLKDMCQVVYAVYQYSITKAVNSKDIKLNSTFVRVVLNNIYEKCGTLFSRIKNLNSPVPQYFVNMVEKCPSMKLKDPQKDIEFVEKERVDIEKRISSLEQLFYYNREYPIQLSNDEIKSFSIKQQQDWEAFMTELNSNDMTDIVRNQEMKTFISNQSIEKEIKYMGERKRERPIQKNDREKYDKDKREYEDNVRELRNGLNNTIKKINLEIANESTKLKEISQLYWNHIIVLITSITDITGKNSLYVSDAINILSASYFFTSEHVDCTTIIDAPSIENCIASAIINILISVKNINNKLKYNQELTLEDLKLPESIILNKDIGNLRTQIEQKKNITNVNQKELMDFAKDFTNTGNNNNKYQTENQTGQYDDNKYQAQNDNKDYTEDDKFAVDIQMPILLPTKDMMNRTEIQNKILEISAISDTTNMKDFIDEFFRTIKSIVKSKVPDGIKSNRIRFFATLKIN
jgi:predicted NAD-dependent protein-ADP-ribosyltransferase YbiA (DUF1768 family)